MNTCVLLPDRALPPIPSIMSMSRPSTPPPRDPLPTNDLTPEQVKRFELNRLKAKARFRESELSTSTSSASSRNANNKRPLQVTPANSNSPTAPSKQPALRKDNRFGNYFEYDLSKMVNSKGGFLIEDHDKIDERTKMLEEQRAAQRSAQKLEPRMTCFPHLAQRTPYS